ncbi:unnamed protein product [Didymodactylos carnosus]|uniref:WWE domain-containing protein n=1 Tax=Didymodactylos carnosus TaxID=1234261 RepID=A0A8S2W7L7_9BILA|nr:unnamed protein product [Didymodactylos carnosus]
MVSQAIKGADQEWTKYSDIESAIIEEAFNQKNKTKLAELNNYSINLNDSIQISKSDPNKQRQIKRVLTSRCESQGLREERFFLTPELSKTFNDDWGKEAYIFLSQWKKDKKLSDAEIVEQAANGIVIEGKQLGQHCESQYLARQIIAEIDDYFAGLNYADGDGLAALALALAYLNYADLAALALALNYADLLNYLNYLHSTIAASSLSPLLVISSSSHEHCRDETEMPSGAM